MKISEAFSFYGSDKNTEHAYGPFYDSLLSSAERGIRPLAVLEIGVEAGYSMQAWLRVLPEGSTVIGVDKDVNGQPFPEKLRSVPFQKRRLLDGLKRKHAEGMLRISDQFPPYFRPENLDVIQAEAPDFSPVIDRCVRDGLMFDLIVDDGSHNESDQVLGAHYLWQFLKVGGRYVIEDIHQQEAVERFRSSGWSIEDYRPINGRWDDVIAWKEKT